LLILVANSSQQQRVQQALQQGLSQQGQHSVGPLPVYTYNGWVRNALFQAWPWVEQRWLERYPQDSKNSKDSQSHSNLPPRQGPQVLPDLLGIEETEGLYHAVLQTEEARLQSPLFSQFPSHRQALVRQLLRRSRLKAEQRLSWPQLHVADAALSLPDAADLRRVEPLLEKEAFRLRVFDGPRQLEIFHALLQQYQGEPHTLLDALGVPLTHVVVDDVDESTPAQQAFVHWLLPQLQHLAVGVDYPHGGSRQSYLGAYPQGWPALQQAISAQWPQATQTLQLEPTGPAKLGEALFQLIQHPARPLNTLEPMAEAGQPTLLSTPTQKTQLHLVDYALGLTKEALAKHPTAYQQWVWVLPTMEPLALAPLLHGLERMGLPYQSLSGTQRPAESLLGKTLLDTLHLLNAMRWGWPLNRMELRHVLGWLLGFYQSEAPQLDALASWVHLHHEAAVTQHNPGDTAHPLLPPAASLPEGALVYEASWKAYDTLCQWLQAHQQEPFGTQLMAVAQQWLYPQLAANSAGQQHTGAVQALWRSWQRFEPLTQRLKAEPPEQAAQRWVWQAKQGTVASTSHAPTTLEPHALWLATPQQAIDLELRRPVHWWWNLTAEDWQRTSSAPLYNTAVHNPLCCGQLTPAQLKHPTQAVETLQQQATFEQAVHQPHVAQRHRVALQTRKLATLATHAIYNLKAQWSHRATEQPHSILSEAFRRAERAQQQGSEDTNDASLSAPLNLDTLALPPLREDQAPVLNYTGGTMAISAVPGAGKTYVSVALLLSLVKQGYAPEGIWVITLMDSAAKTLQQRLAKALEPAGLSTLPQVSTIHALARRILSEGDAYTSLGLEELNIADEATLQAILEPLAAETLGQLHLQGKSERLTPNQWKNTLNSALKQAKSLQLSAATLVAEATATQQPNLAVVGHALATYQQALQAQGVLDFTDLILLALQLLRTQPQWLAYWQGKVQVLLEDEAQDSSPLLQELLSLLGGAQPNVVRVGDLNQSITSTFSGANPEGFRRFIETAQCQVFMLQSQRCAPAIMALANHWVHTAASHQPLLSKAFLPTPLQAATSSNRDETLNPSLLEPLCTTAFETQSEEVEHVIADILRCHKAHPQASMAILCRQRKELTQLAEALQAAGLPVLLHGEEEPAPWVVHLFITHLAVLEHPERPQCRVAWWDALLAGPSRVAQTLQHQHQGDEAAMAQTSNALRQLLAATPLLALPLEELGTLPPVVQQLYYDWHEDARQLGTQQLPAMLLRLAERQALPVLERNTAYLCALKVQEAMARHGLQSPPSLAPNVSAGPQPWLQLSPLSVAQHTLAQALANPKALTLFEEESMGLVETTESLTALHEGRGEGGVVQLMTLHKAKGQEFDLVWLPFLTQQQFADEAKKVPLDDSPRGLDNRLALRLQQLGADRSTPTTETTPPEEKRTAAEWLEAYQRQVLEEEARLLYVGITRAKRGLHLSTHSLPNWHSRWKPSPTHPTLAFTVAKAFLEPPLNPTKTP
jgi:superfamily I DNA/RNA helicase